MLVCARCCLLRCWLPPCHDLTSTYLNNKSQPPPPPLFSRRFQPPRHPSDWSWLPRPRRFSRGVTANMLLIAFGVVVCAMGEVNLVLRGLASQLSALCFEVGTVR